MDTAFLTGATGFVGANLARLLIKQGLAVRALIRKDSDARNLNGLNIECIPGDLHDAITLAKGMAGARYVFHLAADYRLWVPDPAAMHHANVAGTESVLRAAAKAGVERIVHCSSVSAVKPRPNRRPADENDEYRDAGEVVSEYKKSKYLSDVLARRLARSEGLPVVIVNPATPVGPFDVKPTPSGKIIVDFLNSRLPAYIDTGLNLVHVEDVAEGHMLAATRGKNGERYILGGENMTFKHLLDHLSKLTGISAPTFCTPYALAYAFGAMDSAWARLRGSQPTAPLDAVRMARHYMWFTSQKAVDELGYRPRPIEQALKDAIAWFYAHGYAHQTAAA